MFDNSPYVEPAVETKPSLKGFVAWLETQDPDMEYNRVSILDCLVCRYGRQCLGVTGKMVFSSTLDRFGSQDSHLAHQIWTISCRGEPTQGAALKRARALLKEKPNAI